MWLALSSRQRRETWIGFHLSKTSLSPRDFVEPHVLSKTRLAHTQRMLIWSVQVFLLVNVITSEKIRKTRHYSVKLTPDFPNVSMQEPGRWLSVIRKSPSKWLVSVSPRFHFFFFWLAWKQINVTQLCLCMFLYQCLQTLRLRDQTPVPPWHTANDGWSATDASPAHRL